MYNLAAAGDDSVYLPVCLPVAGLSICLSVCLSPVCLSVCLSACLSPETRTQKVMYKLSNLELWSLLTNFYMGFSKNPFFDH